MLRSVKALTRGGLATLCLAVMWVSCGGTSVSGEVGAAGGEVCLTDRKVCIEVPLGGLETQELVRITPGGDKPASALSESFDISAVNGRKTEFLKPATVTMSIDLIDEGTLEALPNVTLLRIYTHDGEKWTALGDAVVDRVRNVVTGKTNHLSPFVLARADILPDGGMPIEIDGGPYDSGTVIVVPPFDGGRPDAGRPDAGRPDSGTPDAGTPDSGIPDAGTPDAGTPDAGMPDAGTPDAGAPDAGAPDAGVDAGFDAGIDAGEPDAGDVDAGEPDAGDDAGVDAGEDAG